MVDLNRIGLSNVDGIVGSYFQAPAVTKGFNFRSTAGFVTDGANETYASAGDSYPTTRNGITFGWTTGGINNLDRDSAVDRRLAGINYILNSGSQLTFRIDLPQAGSWTIRLALGDTGGTQGYQYLQVKDNTSVLFTIDDTDGTTQDNYDDATGTNRTEAAWPGNNASVTHTFSTTTLFIIVGSPASQSGSTTIAHFQISQ